MLNLCTRLITRAVLPYTELRPLPSCKRNEISIFCLRYFAKKTKKSDVKEFKTVKPDLSAAGDQVKKRAGKRKKTVEDLIRRPGYWNLVAFSTGEEYDLEELNKAFRRNEMLEVTNLGNELPNTDFIHAVVKNENKEKDLEQQEVYVFREGAIVTWNVTDIDIEVLLGLVTKHQTGEFQEDIVREECEVMNYTYNTSGIATSISDDDIILCGSEEGRYDKFAISNATALSVKLGTWEATLAKYVDSVKPVTDDFKKGNKISISHSDVMKRTGELFALRHVINLSSDLLDTPDVYWDQEKLEKVYSETIAYFCINKRTRVINEKLNHCMELVDLLSSYLRDRHHVRLEWMIIILILIEVGFEVVHFLEGFTKNEEKIILEIKEEPA